MITAAPSTNPPVRLGVVSYINTLPLIDGLERLHGVELTRHVPARLEALLQEGAVDMALCSSVDYQRSATPLEIVPVGMLGCAGPTLTVRLYARVPLAEVRTLAADMESHTSRALAQLLLRRMGARHTEVEYDRRTGPRAPAADALLLIGDKVVNDAPAPGEWTHELDLGEAWHAWTGLPFVFAAWMVRADLAGERRERVRTLARVLDHQRRHNRERLGDIVFRESAAHGWPAPLAERYLGELLSFALDAEALRGLERFHAECESAGLIARRQPVRLFEW